MLLKEEVKKVLNNKRISSILSSINILQEKLELTTDFNSSEYATLSKSLNRAIALEKYVDQLKKLYNSYLDAEAMLSDNDLQDIAENQLKETEIEILSIINELTDFTQNPLPNDEKKAIIEIRPGVGGNESALFAEELFRMYISYLTSINFPTEVYSITNNQEGGISEVVFLVNEEGSFGKLRFEGGVHRVQRVPKTESMGRIHTSTVAITITPKFETKNIEINQNDLRIDVYRSSGPGGQSVNTTDSAVRITHIPTGIVVTCQSGKSQHKNKEMALSVLYSKLQEIEEKKKEEEANKLKKESVENFERSSKIRTYNFPQARITDHRINKSWFNIEEVMNGDLELIIKETSGRLRE
jgi:peptide chain release factor 1